MAEWSMAVVLKTTEPETVPGVRIPLPPPNHALSLGWRKEWSSDRTVTRSVSWRRRVFNDRVTLAATRLEALTPFLY
jgi:hypothetical protein